MGSSADPPRDVRYEVKLIGEALLLPEMRARLTLHPIGLQTAYPPRRVNSLYFDTHDGRALEENLAGLSHREKIRFRWYGDAVRAVRGRLERKVRRNQLGWKDLEPVDAALDVEGVRRSAFARALAASVSDDWRDELSRLEVVQWITYDREYLSTRGGRLRATLDTGLRAFDQRDRIRISSRWPTTLPDVVVVELKASLDDAHLAQEVLQEMPLVVDKCSKFVLASSPVDGPLRAIAPI